MAIVMGECRRGNPGEGGKTLPPDVHCSCVLRGGFVHLPKAGAKSAALVEEPSINSPARRPQIPRVMVSPPYQYHGFPPVTASSLDAKFILYTISHYHKLTPRA